MLTLGVSTSTHRGSVAILDDEKLVAHVAYDGNAGHAERLFAAIDSALSSANTSRGELGLIACDIGPGSFTGVRVGVAAMQGAAKALGLGIVGVTSLEAMAFAGRLLGHERALVMLDAKKSEVFYAFFTPEVSTEPAHVAVDALSDILRLREDHGAVVFGEIASSIDALAPIRANALDLPDAEMVARIGRTKVVSVSAILLPLYVRAPDAKPSVV